MRKNITGSIGFLLLLFLVSLGQGVFGQSKGVPSVTIGNAFEITESSAKIPYTIIADPEATEQGVCYNTASPVTISDNKTIDLTVNEPRGGADTILLTGLAPAVKRYYEAYAINIDGTTISSETKSFYTLSAEPTTNCGTISITAISPTSVTIQWSAATGANGYGIFTELGPSAVDPALILDGMSATVQTSIGVFQNANGASTSLVRGSLTPNTTYTITVVPSNRKIFYLSETTNFLTSGVVSTITFTTPKEAPTTQSSEISFTNTTYNSTQINWVSGNGDGRIVIINTYSNITAPVNGVYPTADDSWNNSGQQVVYNGSSNSVTVTGLSAVSTYYARVFDYNNAEVGKTQYITTTSTNNPNSVTTLMGPPSEQDHSITFSNISASSMTVSWTNGDGDGRIVVMNDADSYIDPVDGTDYPADNSWSASGAQVVYNGAGTTVDVSNLNPSTTYYFRVFAYNDVPSNSVYNVSEGSDNPKSQKTPATPPSIQDSNFVFSSITDNSVVVSWAKGNGEYSLVSVNTANFFEPLIEGHVYTTNTVWQGSGEQYVYSSNGNQVTVTGLTEGTSYYFRVRGYNDVEPAYNASESNDNPSSMTTNMSVPTIQDNTISFSSVSDSAITINWISGNGSGHLVKMNTVNSFTDPVQNVFNTANSVWADAGEQSVYSGIENSVTVTNLDSLTVYFFRVYAYNSSGSLVSYFTDAAADNPNSQLTGGSVVWSGSVSNSWHTAENWIQSVVPSIGNNVIIPDVGTTDYPVLSQNGSVNNLTIQVKGQLTVSDGFILNVGGDLNILGTSDGSGSLVVQGSGDVSVSGTSTFQRFTGITTDWHLASTPTSNTNINQFNGNYVNRWNELSSTWTTMTAATSIEVMRGYSIKYYNQNTITFSGTFNNGNQSIGVTSAIPGNEDYGWNMVGNPYPSAIDWNSSTGWTRTNIDNTIYKYDASSGSYETFNHATGIGVPSGTTGIIPAGNGYWVLCNVANTTLGVNNDVRVHSLENFNKSDERINYRIVRLRISNGIKSDEMAVMFHPEATHEFNSGIDSYKFFAYKADVPQIYAQSYYHDKKMVVSSVNEAEIDSLEGGDFIEIPIGYANYIEAPITITMNENTLGEQYDVFLYDRTSSNYYDLKTPFEGTSQMGEFNDL